MNRSAKIVLLLAALAIIVAPFVVSSFTVTLLNYIGIYALVTLGIVLLTGIGGLTSLGQAAFVGIGAYTTAWLTTAYHLSPWLGLAAALGLTGLIAAALGAMTLRLGGHFVPLSTVAWGMSIFFLLGNIETLGRHNGITNIPPVSLGSVSLVNPSAFYYLIWGVFAVAALLLNNLLNSREGRAVRSLRGGVTMIESFGIDAFRIRMVTFVVAALLAGLSGWLYAHMTRYVSPTPFGVRMSIEYLFMAIMGGSKYILGAVIGGALVTLLKDGLQDVLTIFRISAQFEIVAFSVVFILVLQFARGGVVPKIRRFMPKRHHIDRRVSPDALSRRQLPKRGETVLEVTGLVKRFGGLVAVNDVSFSVKAGEILALIGPNGAGKSTLFNLMTGTLQSDQGTVLFLGKDTTRSGQKRISKAGIARTFQHVKLRADMTLVDNVLLGAYGRTCAGFIRGSLLLDRAEEASATREAIEQLERVGLGEDPYSLAGNLPLGKQRILEVARALAADPVLIFMDEPAAGLRRLEKLALAALICDLRNAGVTTLLVEHDMDFVMGLADRVLVMNFGSKLIEDTPAAVRAEPRVQEAYLGSVE